MLIVMIVPLGIGLMLLTAGLFCIMRPLYLITWLRSLARPIGGSGLMTSRRIQIQSQQATPRPVFIKILGLIFSGLGLWLLIGTMPAIW